MPHPLIIDDEEHITSPSSNPRKEPTQSVLEGADRSIRLGASHRPLMQNLAPIDQTKWADSAQGQIGPSNNGTPTEQDARGSPVAYVPMELEARGSPVDRVQPTNQGARGSSYIISTQRTEAYRESELGPSERPV